MKWLTALVVGMFARFEFVCRAVYMAEPAQFEADTSDHEGFCFPPERYVNEIDCGNGQTLMTKATCTEMDEKCNFVLFISNDYLSLRFVFYATGNPLFRPDPVV